MIARSVSVDGGSRVCLILAPSHSRLPPFSTPYFKSNSPFVDDSRTTCFSMAMKARETRSHSRSVSPRLALYFVS
jgi:hypothetical protein